MNNNKKLLLITIRNDISTMYLRELKIIFENYLEISTYSFENQNQIPLTKTLTKNFDVILVTSDNVHSLIRNHISKSQSVLSLHFSFTKEKLDKLKSLPYDTNAYIGFKSYSASFRTVSLLYELGINNLNLRVYEPNKVKTEDIDVGIVSDSSTIFPTEVTNIISIGKRKISFQTALDIATSLNILNDDLENKIYSYCDDMPTSHSTLDYLHEKSQSTTIQLRTIINSIEDGFLIFDENGLILDHNTQFDKMFELASNITGTTIYETPALSELAEILQKKLNMDKELIDLKHMRIILSKQKIYSSENKNFINICLLKNITDIMKLEHLLKKELAKKGHIAKYTFDSLISSGNTMKAILEKCKKLSNIDKTTLIYGESGTGKELFAQAIHNNSVRKKYPFIAINCATLPSTLLESELFGYIDGSFTGAAKGGRAGLFEAAHMGTLFLDEIGEINLETQAKLLRVLEEKEVRRLGSSDVLSIDVKIIAATNKNLRELVKMGDFRLDLFYRLNTIMLKIPPLRERMEDLEDLVKFYLEQEGQPELIICPEVWDFFRNYPWEGNVRELKNCIEYMASISENPITMSDIPEYMLEILDCEHMTLNQLEDDELSHKILKLLSQKSMGRRSLTDELRKQNLQISEYKIRDILDHLRSNGYIGFKTGRIGAQITSLGLNFLIQPH